MATTKTTKTPAKSSTTAKKTTSTRKPSTTTKKPAETKISAENEVVTASANDITVGETVRTDPEVELLKQQIELLKAQLSQQQAQPQLVRIANEDEKVVFMWNAEVSDENVVTFGPNGMYGRITGKYGTFFVPKSELSRVLDNQVRYFLDHRWLTIVSGLSQEERQMLDVNYKDGELLSRDAYKFIVEMEDKILDIYPDLHNGHKKAVASRYYEQWQIRNPHVKRDVVLKLIKMSAGEEKVAFQKIIEEMNLEDLQG